MLAKKYKKNRNLAKKSTCWPKNIKKIEIWPKNRNLRKKSPFLPKIEICRMMGNRGLF